MGEKGRQKGDHGDSDEQVGEAGGALKVANSPLAAGGSEVEDAMESVVLRLLGSCSALRMTNARRQSSGRLFVGKTTAVATLVRSGVDG